MNKFIKTQKNKTKSMKKITIILGVFVAILATNFNLSAQDAEISDDNLKLYATVMAKIDVLKSDMKTAVNDMVKGEELMTGGRRYKELKGAKGDEAKYAEIGATEEELAAFNTIMENIGNLKAEFKTSTSTLVKEELGASVYNKVKRALKTDADMKTRYEVIVSALNESGEDAEIEE